MNHTYHILTPFGRIQNLDEMIRLLRTLKIQWHPVFDDSLQFRMDFGHELGWIHPEYCPPTNIPGFIRAHFINNWWMDRQVPEENGRYLFINDDDFLEEGFLEKVDGVEGDIMIVSMKRGHHQPPTGPQYGTETLVAAPENMSPGHVGGEQLIASGKALPRVRFGPNQFGDGEMVVAAVKEFEAAYVPEANVLFNWLEPGRWDK